MKKKSNEQNVEKGNKNVEKLIIFIPTIMCIILVITLINIITNTNKNLDKIIYNAKKEAENTLILTGVATYTKDIENNNPDGVGASIARPLNDIELPENTTEAPQPEGTKVEPKDGWNIETVTAVSVGGGDTVPIPKGFYYVGGDLNTGVIISDNGEDEYDGETDKTTWEYTSNLKGNQFVWIPCEEEEYQKCFEWNGRTQTGTTLMNGSVIENTETSELPQIRKYGGFYIGRYEAGLANTITEFTSAQKDGSPVYNKEGIPQSKAGIIPWNFIDWIHAQTNAKNMYNTESVSSGLITGTQWDVILKTLIGKKKLDGTQLIEEDLINSEKWGNYSNNSIEYNGRKAILNSGTLMAFGGKETSKTNGSNRYLLTTGASKQTGVYNIYDLAGNLWEYTEENSVSSTSGKMGYAIRGGSYAFDSIMQCASYRGCGAATNICGYNWGFRVMFYIK